MSRRFEVALTWEVQENVSLTLRVIGSKRHRLTSIRECWNDPGSPAEGGELEDVRIFSGHRLPSHVEDRLLNDDRFLEAVEAAL